MDSIAILGNRIGEHSAGFHTYCGLFNYEFDFNVVVLPERIATEEEKDKLFQAIKDNGYRWNEETKTLEKLTPDKFDITNLKPFDKVLARDTNRQIWIADLFSHNIE